MFYNGFLNSCRSLGNIAKKGSFCQAKSDALSETCGFITDPWLVMSFHGAKTSSQKHQLLKQVNLKSVAKNLQSVPQQITTPQAFVMLCIQHSKCYSKIPS